MRQITNLFKSLKLALALQCRTYCDYTPKALRSLKAKSNRDSVQYYLDTYRIRAVAGNGGDGCISFLSVWCKDHAGPDGGDGGNGGHVIFQVSTCRLCFEKHRYLVLLESVYPVSNLS